MVLMKGTTGKCEETVRTEFGNGIRDGRLIVMRSLKGWCDTEVACQFLEVFNRIAKGLYTLSRSRSRRRSSGSCTHPTATTRPRQNGKARSGRSWSGSRVHSSRDDRQTATARPEESGELKSRARSLIVQDLSADGVERSATAMSVLRHFPESWDSISSDNVVAWNALIRE
jgi:hypothetical protein